MTDQSHQQTEYQPPRVWVPSANGGPFASINRPTAGPTHEKELPVGKHPLQLYSLGTPNGQKVTIMLEELLAAGHGHAVLGRGADPQAPQLRLGLIQSNLTDLEARRRTQGSYEVVRELLDRRVRSTSDLVESLGLPERAMLDSVLSCTAIGAPDTVSRQL